MQHAREQIQPVGICEVVTGIAISFHFFFHNFDVCYVKRLLPSVLLEVFCTYVSTLALKQYLQSHPH